MKTSVIIPAAGVGSRFGADIPKQFIEIDGAPVIVHTIRIFEMCPEVEHVVLPVHEEYINKMREMAIKYKLTKVREIIEGGETRQHSVLNGLETASAESSDIVLIHDAVRPLATPALVKKIIEQTEEFGAVIPALSPKETIKEVTKQGTVLKTMRREYLKMVQTPQGFWQELIYNAYVNATKAGFIGTDSASLVEFMSYKVQVIDGDDNNLKITTPMDRHIAEVLIKEARDQKMKDAGYETSI